jgi:DNA-binding GntR family transcriptional regulator
MGRRAGQAASTLTSTLYEQIRREIVRGILLPGTKLRINSLSDRYEVGGSPIREALTRLSAEGFVTQESQRGFHVAFVSLDELRELSQTRCWINQVALREAITNGDAAWEEGIVVAFHRLSRLPAVGRDTPDDHVAERERRHRAFHAALISACNSRWLCNFAEMMFDCADRYRFLAHASGQGRDSMSEHRAIMEAVVNRDVETAIHLVDRHVLLTEEAIRRSGATCLTAPEGARKRVRSPGQSQDDVGRTQ